MMKVMLLWCVFREVWKLKKRYEVGLEKLGAASSDVGVMQKELNDLQPQLITASKDVDEMMVIIEKDSIEVGKEKDCRKELSLHSVVCKGAKKEWFRLHEVIILKKFHVCDLKGIYLRQNKSMNQGS